MLRIATRASELARWQAEEVARLLRRADPGLAVELVLIETTADKTLDVSIASMGGKGVFVKEIQLALLDGRADIAVHSAKDLPAVTVPGLVLAAVPERGDVRDALVGASISDLHAGSVVGTGSARRRVQLVERCGDVTFGELRGNMARRLAQAGDFDAIVVAAVALERLGLGGHITEILDIDVMTPQVGQGALAVECRVADAHLVALLATIEHAPSRQRIDAERGFLAELGGDCTLPAGAHAVIDGETLQVSGLLGSPDGSTVLRHNVTRSLSSGDASAAGRDLASYLLEHGGRALLSQD